MFGVLFIVLLFLYLGTGVVKNLLAIYKFLTKEDKSANHECRCKSKLVE